MAERDREKRDEAQKQQGEIANLIERARATEADGRPRGPNLLPHRRPRCQQPELREMALARLAASPGAATRKWLPRNRRCRPARSLVGVGGADRVHPDASAGCSPGQFADLQGRLS